MSRTTTNRWFGEVVVDDDDLWVKTTIELNGRTSRAHLSSDPEVITDDHLWGVFVGGLDTLDDLDRRARARLSEELTADDPTARDFLDFHLDEIPEIEAVAVALGTDVPQVTLLASLELHGVWAAVDGERTFTMTLDYMVPGADSDQILCVRFNTDLQIMYVAHES